MRWAIEGPPPRTRTNPRRWRSSRRCPAGSGSWRRASSQKTAPSARRRLPRRRRRCRAAPTCTTQVGRGGRVTETGGRRRRKSRRQQLGRVAACMRRQPGAGRAAHNHAWGKLGAACHWQSRAQLCCPHAAPPCHTGCIRTWLQRKSTCPLCRTPVPDMAPRPPSAEELAQIAEFRRLQQLYPLPPMAYGSEGEDAPSERHEGPGSSRQPGGGGRGSGAGGRGRRRAPRARRGGGRFGGQGR